MKCIGRNPFIRINKETLELLENYSKSKEVENF